MSFNGKPVTRTLKDIPNKFIQEFLRNNLPDGLKGEIIVGEPNLETTYNTTQSAVMSQDGEPDFTFYVFDTISYPNMTFRERIDMLRSTSKYWTQPWLKLLPQTLIMNEVQLQEYYEEQLQNGYECCILRAVDGIYKYGRSTAKQQLALKMKPFRDKEAVIIGTYEAMENTNEATKDNLGRTVRSSHQDGKVGKGTLGGFICLDDEYGEIDVPPGKLDHKTRQHLWDIRDTLPGQILKYRFMSFGIKDKPRQLRALGLRSLIDM